MELILILIGIGVVGVFAYSHFNTNLRNPTTLPGRELESVWVEVKRKILETCPYTQENLYESIFYRTKDLLTSIIERHSRFLDDFQANKKLSDKLGFYLTSSAGSQPYEQKTWCVTSNLDVEHLPSDLLFILCFVSYRGAVLNHFGIKISENKWFLNRGIEYLINARGYPPALFLKGVVLKYGFELYSTPDLIEAKKLLKAAGEMGVGAALVELEHFDAHQSLLNVKSVHKPRERWLEGAELEEYEKARKDWVT